MKIEADVLGVEQAVNFDTMETTAFVVVEILGEVLRIAISEEQMERLTLNAVQQHRGHTAEFEHTETKAAMSDEERAQISSGPIVRVADAPARDFSVMGGLTDHTIADESEPSMMGDIFGDPEEEAAKIARLRQRPLPVMPGTRSAPVEVQHSSSLPQMAGVTSIADDDFPQG